MAPLIENETPASAMSVLLLILALTLSEAFVICLCKLMAVYAEYSFYARFSDAEDIALTANVRGHTERERRRARAKQSEAERTKDIEVAMLTCHYFCPAPRKDNSVPTVTGNKNGFSFLTEKPGFEHLDVDSCPVCLLEFDEGDKISRSRNCMHTFHGHCIYEWLKNHDTCPLCRQDVFVPGKGTEFLSNSDNIRRELDREEFNVRMQGHNPDLPWFSGRNLDPELWTFLF